MSLWGFCGACRGACSTDHGPLQPCTYCEMDWPASYFRGPRGRQCNLCRLALRSTKDRAKYASDAALRADKKARAKAWWTARPERRRQRWVAWRSRMRSKRVLVSYGEPGRRRSHSRAHIILRDHRGKLRAGCGRPVLDLRSVETSSLPLCAACRDSAGSLIGLQERPPACRIDFRPPKKSAVAA